MWSVVAMTPCEKYWVWTLVLVCVHVYNICSVKQSTWIPVPIYSSKAKERFILAKGEDTRGLAPGEVNVNVVVTQFELLLVISCIIV